MFSNRRPYYGLKLSIADFFREPVRYLKQSNTQESMIEKPYLLDEYPKMHLKLPDVKFKSYKRRKLRPSGTFGPISEGAQNVTYWNMSHKCGFITAMGRRGGGLGLIGSGFGGFIGYGFGLGCKDETDITFDAPSFSSDEDWIWEFSVHSSEIDTGNVSLTRIDSNTVTLGITGDADGKLDICGEGTNIRTGAKLFCCHYVEVNCDLCGCKNIGYTTQQMSGGEDQTLSVDGPESGCTYYWTIASGGGSLSSGTGTSVVYTAPVANVDCLSNPTIELSVSDGGASCDTLKIAINTMGAGWTAGQWYDNVAIIDTSPFDECTQTTGTCTGCYIHRAKKAMKRRFYCDGGWVDPVGSPCGSASSCSSWNCSYCADGETCPGSCAGQCEYPDSSTIINNCISSCGDIDRRDAWLLSKGCCPEQLL